jgi:radical SAM superfamily enzyme YgiQ (UPF0313 family)
MKVHLVNPSNMSFGTAVITPRWLYVLAAATPASYGDPHLVDETLESLDPLSIGNGDMVGISIHTGNTLRGYEIGQLARNRGAWVVFGGIHATLYPEEAHQLGGAHAVVKGDGDVIWASVLEDCHNNAPRPIYEAGRIGAAHSNQRVGTCCRRTDTCGLLSRPFGVVPNTVPFALSGVLTDSSLASALLTSCWKRS